MSFEPDVVRAVLAHMNDDHSDDSLLIARAFGPPSTTAARMTGLDSTSGHWEVEVDGRLVELRVPWPAGPISERPEIRREVVALYDAACERLGLPPRAHD